MCLIENFDVDCEKEHNHCGIQEVLNFCQKNFNWKPSPSWVSKFLNSREIPIRSHKVQKRPAKRNRDYIEEDIKKFRDDLEALRTKKSRGKVWHMDETGLWNDPIHKKSYSRNGITPMETTTDDHGRDTVVLTCREDGKKLDAFYIQHKRKKYSTKKTITGNRVKVIEDKGISGMNNSLMMDWCKWFIEQPLVKLKNDILCYDQLRSHLNQEVMEFLESTGLKILPFPKGTAPILSMLDNSLFKDFKNYFNDAWIKNGRKIEDKESLVHTVWKEFPSKNIKGYWRKCGYKPKVTKKLRKMEKKVVKKKKTQKKFENCKKQ
jgi:hypothetical protein